MMQKERGDKKLILVLLAIMICPSFFSGFGQNATPVKVSLHNTGAPQFPNGYWASNSDSHFRHRRDKLFWLNSENIAMTFFKGFCCRSGDDEGVRYGAAVFDTGGKKIRTHDWTSMPDAPFGVEGADGSFWLRYNDHIDVLNGDFTVTGQIPLPVRIYPTQSQNGDWITVNDGGKLSIYRVGETSPTATLVLPPNTSVVDVNNHAVLVNGKLCNSCYMWAFGRLEEIALGT
jgi:hypothetical protein